MYGTQTGCMVLDILSPFENDVKMYGTQTSAVATRSMTVFENDVKNVWYSNHSGYIPHLQYV